ncbi:MAG: hypothetical protein RR424_11085, partial [Oscillospiraceae bacterium]
SKLKTNIRKTAKIEQILLKCNELCYNNLTVLPKSKILTPERTLKHSNPSRACCGAAKLRLCYNNLKGGYRHSASRLQGLRLDFENIETLKCYNNLTVLPKSKILTPERALKHSNSSRDCCKR